MKLMNKIISVVLILSVLFSFTVLTVNADGAYPMEISEVEYKSGGISAVKAANSGYAGNARALIAVYENAEVVDGIRVNGGSTVIDPWLEELGY